MVEATEIHKQATELAEAHRRDGFNRIVALTVAILALIMVLGRVKSSNLTTSVVTAQMQLFQSWSRFEEITTRARVLDTQIQNWEIMKGLAGLQITPAQQQQVQETIGKFQTEFANVKDNMARMQAQAKQSQTVRDALVSQQHLLQFSEALLTLAITLFAVSALVRSKPLYALGLAVSLVGVLFELGAFLNWNLHVSFLSFLA
jgi:hypothetical protein